jgi:hypothetical protein
VVWLTGYAAPVRTRLAIFVAIFVTIAVTLVACKDHDLAILGDVKAEVCACKTASCAEQALKRVPADTIKPTRTSRTLAREMMDCLARLHAAERPSTDPDAEGSGTALEGSAAPAPGSAAAPAPARK